MCLPKSILVNDCHSDVSPAVILTSHQQSILILICFWAQKRPIILSCPGRRRPIEPAHDKTNKMTCSLSEYSAQTGRVLSLASHWSHIEDSDQTGRMPRLIWVYAWHTGQFVGFVMWPLSAWCQVSDHCPYIRWLVFQLLETKVQFKILLSDLL